MACRLGLLCNLQRCHHWKDLGLHHPHARWVRQGPTKGGTCPGPHRKLVAELDVQPTPIWCHCPHGSFSFQGWTEKVGTCGRGHDRQLIESTSSWSVSSSSRSFPTPSPGSSNHTLGHMFVLFGDYPLSKGMFYLTPNSDSTEISLPSFIQQYLLSTDHHPTPPTEYFRPHGTQQGT